MKKILKQHILLSIDASFCVSPNIQRRSNKYSVLPNGDLLLKSTETSDAFRSYRCKGQHKLTGETYMSSNAGKVIVTEPHRQIPARITESVPSIRGYEGETLFLPCISQGFPVPKSIWFKRQNGYQSNAPVLLVNDARISLLENTGVLIEKTAILHSGRYSCHVNNSLGKDSIETEVKIYATLSAFIEPDSQTVDVGNQAVFRCRVVGHPVKSIVWYKNAKPVKINARINLISREILRIDSVQREDRGMFQCIVGNDLETAQGLGQLDIGESEPKFVVTFREQVVDSSSSVSLKCGATGNPLPQITWSLDTLPITEAYHIRIGDYVSDIYTVNSYVNISSVKSDDGGFYTCRAKNTAGVVVHKARLNVVGPPAIRFMPNVTALSNQKVIIHCSYSGYPTKSISWIRDGRRLPQNHRQKVFTNGTLVISDVERNSDAGKYECNVQNEEGRIAKRDVFINVIVSPVVEPFSFSNDLVAGKRAGVACIVSSGDLPMNITWLKDGQQLPVALAASINSNDFTSFLSFTAVSRAHNGNYTCEAPNPAHKANYTATMIVQVPPTWIIEPKDKSVVKGHSIRFDCQADGFPLPIIRWKKSIDGEDFKVVISNANIQTLENGSLTIRDASKMDAGQYMCQAINGVGPGASTVVRLTVNVAAHFEKKFETQTVKKGDDVSLSCKAMGEKIIKILWSKDRQPINANNEPRYTFEEEEGDEFSKSIIRIASVDRRDSALFTCSAHNTFGKDSTNFQVLVQEPPDCPPDLKASEIGSRLITLTWNHPYSGNSPVTNYIIEYKPKLSFKNANARTYKETIESNALNHVIKGLDSQTEYMFSVIAQNLIGQSVACLAITVQTDSEAPTVSPRNVKAIAMSSTSIEVTWKMQSTTDTKTAIMGYYVGYRLQGTNDDFSYKTEEAKDHKKADEYHTTITGLRKLSRYAITIQAFNKKGAGPPSDEVDVQTLEFDPPDPPLLKVMSTTASSIAVSWESSEPESPDPLTGYILFHKSELSDWEEIPIYADRLNYNLSNLQCGRRYQFYIIAFNSAGKGQPSDVVSAKTEGTGPIPPEVHQFITLNSTFVTLNLDTWKSGGCPILNFNIQYKLRSNGDFVLLSNNVLPKQQTIVISDLMPATWYTLLIAAYNEAAPSEAEYVFATLTSNGEPIQSFASEAMDDFANQLKLAMPIISTLTVLILISAVVFAMFKRRQSFASGEQLSGNIKTANDVIIYFGSEGNNYELGKSCEAVALNEWDNCNKRVTMNHCNEEQQRRLSMSNLGKANEQIYFPSPYALSRVSVYEQNGQNVSNSQPCLQQPQQQQLTSQGSHHYDVPFKKLKV
ncbi:Down syndrome cell adhesion molecule-like protein [Leptotrombidium deliense]|uniref:Down syndrome cell adhesion molecule-like protein n=1 Tax=Leptotrombidium deliense TaxID=299467 RepID=A0A443SKZ3_9ACAR|nr:Down syndrome cell adhesion molecule-like protein [Leptotrombidium deliense]